MLIPNLVAAALLVSPAPLSTGSEAQQGQESVTAEQLEELTRLVDAMSSEEEPTARMALADRVLALDWTTPKAQAFAHAIRGVALTELDREAEAVSYTHLTLPTKA